MHTLLQLLPPSTDSRSLLLSTLSPVHTLESLKQHPAWPRLARIMQLDDSGNVSEDEGGLFDVEPQLIAVH